MYMNIILYNPLSNKGKNALVALKIKKKLLKNKQESMIENILLITNVAKFLRNLNEDDRIIIVGGDGTLHRLVNNVSLNQVTQEVFMYRAGSGNDFLRSIKAHGKLVDIKPYLYEFPMLTTPKQQVKMINGAGIGLDGMVVHRVNQSKVLKNKSNYFKNALVSFFKFKPVSAEIHIDGKVIKEKKLWFATTMYASYFGGGMKIAPKKKRLDGKVELVLVRNIPKLLLLLIFPTIYLGWHRIFKSFVQIYSANHIYVKIEHPSYLQVDGEDEYPVDFYEVKI